MTSRQETYQERLDGPQDEYERLLAGDLLAHDANLRQLLAWDKGQEATAVQTARRGQVVGRDVTEVVAGFRQHMAGLPAIVEAHLQAAQNQFAGRFAESPLDNERWKALRTHLKYNPLGVDVFMHVSSVPSQYSRRAFQAALDLDVWQRLRREIAGYPAGDPRSGLALVLASTPVAAELMANATDAGRQQRAMAEIGRFSVVQTAARESYSRASPTTQSLAGFLLGLYESRGTK